MTTYRSRITVPDVMGSFLQEINGYATIVDITDVDIEVELESDDPLTLGREVQCLEDALTAIACEKVSVSTPEAQA